MSFSFNQKEEEKHFNGANNTSFNKDVTRKTIIINLYKTNLQTKLLV